MHNGYPVFMAEMTLLTALRTAATSAFAARALARPDSSVMALIGTGSQAEFQAIAFREVLGISRLRIFDTDPDAMAKLVRNLTPLGFEIEVCGIGGRGGRGADIVTTCTADKTNATVLRDEDVQPGTHLNAIGGDCPGKTELDPAILDRAGVFVEYTPQTRIEGELQNKPADFAVTELWEVVTGRRARPHLGRADHAVRLRRVRDRGLQRPALPARQRHRHLGVHRHRPHRGAPRTRRTSSAWFRNSAPSSRREVAHLPRSEAREQCVLAQSVDPLDALTEIAFLLERDRAIRYKSKAFRTAGDVLAGLDPGDRWPIRCG